MRGLSVKRKDMTLKKTTTIKVDKTCVEVLAQVRADHNSKDPNQSHLVEDLVISRFTNELYSETCLCTYHNTDGVRISCVCMNQQQLNDFLKEIQVFNTGLHKALLCKLLIVSIREKEFREERGYDIYDIPTLRLLDDLIGDLHAK